MKSPTLKVRFLVCDFELFALFVAPGERLSIAVDLAAQAALLRAWNVQPNKQTWSFVQQAFDAQHYSQPNHRLADVVKE